jgi:holo-[acyl-carrier protein] synthase
MIHGVGVDVLRTERLEPLRGLWDDAFFRRTFTEAERTEALQRRDPLAHFAGRFAAKEAIFKALRANSNAAHLSHIEILAQPEGYLTATLLGAAAALLDPGAIIHVSISHETDCVIAFAVIA